MVKNEESNLIDRFYGERGLSGVGVVYFCGAIQRLTQWSVYMFFLKLFSFRSGNE